MSSRNNWCEIINFTSGVMENPLDTPQKQCKHETVEKPRHSNRAVTCSINKAVDFKLQIYNCSIAVTYIKILTNTLMIRGIVFE